MLGGIGEEGLYKLINSGEIKSYLDGKRRLIIVQSIEEHIARRLAQAGAARGDAPRRSSDPGRTSVDSAKVEDRELAVLPAPRRCL
jgi:hypothetical protein